MDELDVNFLPLVHDILKNVDKEPHEANQKIKELSAKLQQAREQIEKLPGIEYSQEEQLRQIEVLRKQLISKTDMLKKYKNMCNFDVPK